MKKIFALLLAAAMLLGLCACGGSNPYQALNDALKDGDYNTVKFELTAVSPDFAAEQEKLHKYGSLIDALESENYEQALMSFAGLIPTEPVPEYHVVKIDKDNFFDYFQRGTFTQQEDYNQFGQLESKAVGDGYFLKPEYAEKLANTYIGNEETRSEVSVRVFRVSDDYLFETDPETGDLTIGEKIQDYYNYHEEKEESLTSDIKWSNESQRFTGLHITAGWYSTIYNGTVSDHSTIYTNGMEIKYISAVTELELLDAAGVLYLLD